MENVNQIFYFILTIFISSISINAFLELKGSNKSHRSDIYWILSLSLLIVWSAAFTIAPNTSYFFLTIANTSNFGAMICIGLLLRSSNKIITKRLEISALLLLLAYGISFEYLRAEENFLARTYLVISGVSCMNIWQLKETWSINKKKQSIHLKFIFLIIFVQILITILRVSVSPTQSALSVKNIYHETEQAVIIRIFWSSSFLLLLNFISNYFYEKLLITERKTINELEKKKVKLLAKTKENIEIKALLEERSSLINSLILANKTAATGALSASIAHELNQPIAAIQLNIDYLKTIIDDNKHDNHTSLREIIEDIQNDNQRAARIIRTLNEMV